jgi:hypothetical protein
MNLAARLLVGCIVDGSFLNRNLTAKSNAGEMSEIVNRIPCQRHSGYATAESRIMRKLSAAFRSHAAKRS